MDMLGSESEIVTRMRRRFLTGFLDILILLKLRKSPLSGYDIMSYFPKRFNMAFNMAFSSGTVYSCLYRLERDELIKGELTQRKRVYTLTEKGNETVKTLLNKRDKILGLLVSLFVD
jgi:DNA-binding PadR family transcriptional regulator